MFFDHLWVTSFSYISFKESLKISLHLSQFVRNLSNLRPIQVNADGSASFEIDMDLIEQSSRIFLYKVSVTTKIVALLLLKVALSFICVRDQAVKLTQMF